RCYLVARRYGRQPVMPDKSTEPAPERFYRRLSDRIDRLEDAISHFYDHPQRAGANVFAAEIFVARYGLVAERQQRVAGDAECTADPGQADNRDPHDEGGDPLA